MCSDMASLCKSLYKFGENVSPHILHKKSCCDLNLKRIFAYLPSFFSQILEFILLNGFDFYFFIYFEWSDTENQQ